MGENSCNRMTWDTHSNGRVIWITGLSGAGKSTVARATAEQLRKIGPTPVLIDGDEIRAAIRDPHTGHDPSSRLDNAYRISRLAKLFADQGHMVIVATMSIYHEIHDWNRANLLGYFEVWVESACQRCVIVMRAGFTRALRLVLPRMCPAWTSTTSDRSSPTSSSTTIRPCRIPTR